MPFFADMILPLSYWFYQQTLTCSGSLPLMLLHYLPGLPAAHVLASSSLLNYLKSNFCTLSKRCDRITAAQKCLLFRRTKARDTLRRKMHIPLQMCASPLWFTPWGGQTWALPITEAFRKDRKGVPAVMIHCIMTSEGCSWQQKINPASYAFQHSKLFSFPWLTRWRQFVPLKMNCFTGKNLQITWHKDCHSWKLRRKAGQRHTSHQKITNTTCTFLAPSFLCQ